MVYKRPGVYISENLTPLAPSPDTSGSATAAFVGVSALGGPTLPTFVTSWAQYVALYGSFNGTDLLPYSVYEYFNNGGSGCYVVRAACANAVVAHVTIQDVETPTPADVLKVSAIAPGVWGNAITVAVVADAARFDLAITRGSTVETFNSLSLDPADSRNAISVVNSPVSGSALVALAYLGPTPYTSANAPAVTSAESLSSGAEGSTTPDLVAATELLEVVTTPLDVNLPGINSSTTLNAILVWAALRNNIFLVVDGIQGASTDTAATNATAQEALITGGSSITAASIAAIYAPWIIAEDPSSTVPGASRLLPPGGFVLGQFARSDIVKGVQKAPAGTSTSLRGALAPMFRYSSADLDAMQPVGLNIIRTTPGAGICIWGARTTKPGMPDRYVSIRRTLIYLEYALIQLTRPAIFEDNDEGLWSYLTQIISQFLQNQWQAGVLKGKSPSEAFYIQCDATNNPASSADAGLVNIQIGLALSSPAEFIVINIGQSLIGSMAA
jgi:phage tail sheath protein FI